ncbi:hypothetical protein GLX30_30335 [Streptomyces sp. Tu 2975]|uniref:hypothetical protein n=1 Tax=Streptomyces sp. Tu 2975 TaxID=2676871 RepID=UPI001359545C|nr:hypothetical protein [Streptomyces sp. Tu 2975]QIP87613.1 hypothetical protein GLX30_30335 [Streptomyces sp. Tu 2975]
MTRTALRLVTADLDAYEADRRARLDLQARYEEALQSWDRIEMVRIEALAADYDTRHPGETPVLAGLEHVDYPAAA